MGRNAADRSGTMDRAARSFLRASPCGPSLFVVRVLGSCGRISRGCFWAWVRPAGLVQIHETGSIQTLKEGRRKIHE